MQGTALDFHPSSRKLRQFAGFWLVVFAGLAMAQASWQRPLPAVLFVGLSLIVGLPGLLRLCLVRPVYVGATLLTFPLGWTVSRMVLLCLFFGVFIPVALVFRLIGRDVLDRRPQSKRESYWTPKPIPSSVDRYFRPF